jgi:hypothetical protein
MTTTAPANGPGRGTMMTTRIARGPAGGPETKTMMTDRGGGRRRPDREPVR